jgi:hypothetical protein
VVEMGSCYLLPRLAFCGSWDYRHEPLCLALVPEFLGRRLPFEEYVDE